MTNQQGSGRRAVTRGAEPSSGHVESVTTVVGGQPPRQVRARNRVPIGVEKVPYLAATDAAFRTALLEDRPAALGRVGVRLSDIERTTLLAVPRSSLEAMIARISPERHGRRSFMKAVAAATVSLAAGAAAGCVDDADRTPDAVADAAEVPETSPVRGETGDVPDTVEVEAVYPEAAPGDVMPDADIDPGFEPDEGE